MPSRKAKKATSGRVSILAFDSLPSYLRQITDRQSTPRLSLTAIAKATGLSQPYWSQVVAGTLQPTENAVNRLATALSLKPTERKHLLRLCDLERSQNVPSRIAAISKIARNQSVADNWQLDTTLLTYLSDWKNVAVRNLANIPGTKPNAARIARKLRRKVTEKQVERILAQLIQLGLLIVGDNGAISLTTPEVRTNAQIHHEIVRAFHDQNADNARWALANIDAHDRSFASVTSQVDPAALPELWAKIQELRAQIAQFTRARAGDNGVLVQINLQAFPLSYADAQKDGV